MRGGDPCGRPRSSRYNPHLISVGERATNHWHKEKAASMSTTMKPTEVGTAFLTTPVSETADKIFTLEQADEEQRWIAESAATFMKREVLPNIEAIDHQEPGLLASLVKKAGEQGLRSEEHTSELQSHVNLVCRLLLE